MSKLKKSRLIKDTKVSSTDVETTPISTPLTNALVLKYLKYCQKTSMALADTAFDEFLALWLAGFDREIERARSNQEAMEFAGIQRTIKNRGPELKRYFCGYFSEGFVKFSKKTLYTGISDGDDEKNINKELSLLDNQALEEAIAISSITHRADAHFSEPLWAINQRFSVLNNGEPVTEASNPVAPVQLCDALRRAFRLLKVDVKIKIMAFKIFDRQIDALTQNLLESCNNYLQQQGILPNLKYKLSSEKRYRTQEELGKVSSTASPMSKPFEQLKDYLGEDHEQQLIYSIRRLQKCVSQANDLHESLSSGNENKAGKINTDSIDEHSETSVTNSSVASTEDLLVVLNNLHGLSSDTQSDMKAELLPDLNKPADVKSLSGRIKDRLKKITNKTDVAQYDMQTIDLVGLLFEYMLNEELLPDRIKTLLSHLHTPFLKIAFLDADFFEHKEHPARLLLNALTDAGCKWVDANNESNFSIYEKIRYIVDRILKTRENEVKVIAECLLSFRSETKQLEQKQELMEKRAKEKAEGEDKLRQAKQRVHAEIKVRIKDKKLPSTVLLFLIKVWSDYMSFVVLRYGQMSKSWEDSLALIDDLIWSSELKSTTEDQSRQRDLQSVLLKKIQRGLDSISFSKTKMENIIDALSGVFDKVKNKVESESVDPRERDELMLQVHEKAEEAPPVMEPATAEEAALVENLNMIEFGTWLEYSDGTRLKIAWYNAHTTQYMLVNQMGKREHMITALTLARQMIEQKVKVISGSSKPFFERALENILERLSTQSEQLQTGDANE